MKPRLGVLKTTTHIVFLNLDYLLLVSALPFLLVYFFKALAFPAAPSSTDTSTLTSTSILGDVFFVLLCNTRDLLALRSLNPNPNLHSFWNVLSRLSFVFYSIMLANQLNGVYEIAATIIVCRNFAISAMLGVIAGAVYTVMTMCSWDKCYAIVEESRRWVDYLIMWCIHVVKTSIWVAGVLWLVASLFLSVLPSWILDKADVLSLMWRWVAAGVSVSLLPNLFLCVMSTHAALYLSCRTHHKKSSGDTLIDSSAPLLDEELARSAP